MQPQGLHLYFETRGSPAEGRPLPKLAPSGAREEGHPLPKLASLAPRWRVGASDLPRPLTLVGPNLAAGRWGQDQGDPGPLSDLNWPPIRPGPGSDLPIFIPRTLPTSYDMISVL